MHHNRLFGNGIPGSMSERDFGSFLQQRLIGSAVGAGGGIGVLPIGSFSGFHSMTVRSIVSMILLMYNVHCENTGLNRFSPAFQGYDHTKKLPSFMYRLSVLVT